MELSRQLVREQGTQSVPEYRQRVHRLAAIYAALLLTSVSTIVLIVVRGKFFVTLSQRSNVETLTLAFVIVLFAYLAVVSFPGAWGALRIAYYNAPAWIGRDRGAVERRKQAALKPKRGEPGSAYLNCLVRPQGRGDAPVTIPIEDDAGSLGRVVISGAKMVHEEALQEGSNSLFAFFEWRIEQVVRERDPEATVEIVQWATIDDEAALQYQSLVDFSRNLERHLGSGPLWPVVELTDGDVATLAREAREICPSLRDEAQLPDLEFQAEHRLPIIPEPLGFIALARQERRADPVASMGCALIVTVAILAFVLLFILLPPWVPPR